MPRQVQSTLGIEVMTAPDVRYRVKAMIRLALDADPVDAINDLELALRVAKAEWDDIATTGLVIEQRG